MEKPTIQPENNERLSFSEDMSPMVASSDLRIAKEHQQFTGNESELTPSIPANQLKNSLIPKNSSEQSNQREKIISQLDRMDDAYGSIQRLLFDDLTNPAKDFEPSSPEHKSYLQDSVETARKIHQLLDLLRASRQSDNPLISLRAEYLTARAYGLMDSDFYLHRHIGDDYKTIDVNPLGDDIYIEEQHEYMEKYTDLFFEVTDLNKERGAETKVFTDISHLQDITDQVSIPEEYLKSGQSMKVIQIAKNGAIFVDESSFGGGKIVGFADVDIESLPSARHPYASSSLARVHLIENFDEDNPIHHAWKMIMFKPGMCQAVESKLGFKLSEIHLQEQLYLLDFMISADQTRFDRLANVTRGLKEVFLPGNYRGITGGQMEAETYIELFLSLQHGEDLGESLLIICEDYIQQEKDRQKDYSNTDKNHYQIYKLAPNTESEQTLLSVLDTWHLCEAIASEMEAISYEFSEDLKDAFTRRLSEVLVVVEEIIKNGTAQASMLDGSQVKYSSHEHVNLILMGLTRDLAYLKTALYDEDDKIYQFTDENGLVSFFSEVNPRYSIDSNIIIQLRPYGTEYGRHDHEREYNGEARINFLITRPGEHLSSDQVNDPIRRSALSIRIDREGLEVDEARRVIRNDPTVKQGTVSLDIGSIAGDEDDPNVIVGRLLATGNAIISARRGQNPNFNHVRESFDPKWGNAKNFAKLVTDFQHHLEQHADL